MSRRKKKKNGNFLSLLIFVFVLGYYIYNNQNDIKDKISQSLHLDTNYKETTTNLEIYYLDVGQADSVLIRNQNHNVLIDAGNEEDGPLLVKYLKNIGVNKFDYVVGTHPHEDHIGGLDDIINNFKVDNVLLPEAYTTTKTFNEVLDAIEKNNLQITVPKIDERISVGECDYDVLYTGKDVEDLNDASIVLKLTFGSTTYIFTGDATTKVEKQLLNKDIDVDVLKVGHHGSPYSSNPMFIKKVNPKYAIVSVGEDNSYNHPSKDVINRIKLYTDKIYMTKDLGTILLKSDGKNIEITNMKTNTNG